MTKRFERALTIDELRAMSDEDIDLGDVPELDDALRDGARRRYPAEAKERLTVKVDEKVVSWLRSQESDLETLVNEALRTFYEDRAGRVAGKADG